MRLDQKDCKIFIIARLSDNPDALCLKADLEHGNSTDGSLIRLIEPSGR